MPAADLREVLLFAAAFHEDERAAVVGSLDGACGVVVANRAFRELTGYRSGDLEGLPASTLWPGDEPVTSSGGRASLRCADSSTVAVVVAARRHLVVAGAGYTLDRILEAPSADAVAAVAGLTRRQRQVLGLLADGATTDQIADRLVISYSTARNHVAGILRALGCHSRLQAVVVARRAGG